MSNDFNQETKYVDANVKLSFAERLHYGLGDFGYNFIYYWISAYMMIFLTDSVGVAAASVSSLMLVMRLFDAFNDPIIGSMADRTKSRWGRYRPWILIGGIALGISIVLMFAARADWSSTTKIIYMWVIYLVVTVASTCCNMPFGALGGVITSNAGERVKLSGMRMVFANIGLQGCGVVAIPLLTMVGGVAADGSYTASGYFQAVLITVIIGVPFLVWCACKTRERLQPPPTQTSIPLNKQFGCLKNKYIFICVLCNFLAGIVMYGKMTMITYYFAYVCRDPGLMTSYSMINLVGAVVGAGIGADVLYKWLKNKGRAGLIINVISMIGCTAMYFFLATSPVWMGINFIVGLFAGASGAIGYSMIPDAIDVAELETGVRCDGFLASFVSLALKIGGAIGPALGGAALVAFGYVANAEQSQAVLTMLNVSVTLVPALCAFVQVIAYLFYDLDDTRHAQIRDELAARRQVQE